MKNRVLLCKLHEYFWKVTDNAEEEIFENAYSMSITHVCAPRTYENKTKKHHWNQ